MPTKKNSTPLAKCTTQAELDAALKDPAVTDIWLVGAGYFSISGSASVTAYDSASVTASDSASVTASDSASVRASGSASVRASKFVAVQRHGTIAKVNGGVLIQIPEIKTPVDWCDYFDVAVVDGIATLYKGVGADFKSPHGADYSPGSTPIAADWKATNECGYGLHFSPRPVLTLRYNREAVKYVACGVRVDAMVVITADGYGVPDKVKAEHVSTPCVECDIDGVLVPQKAGVA